MKRFMALMLAVIFVAGALGTGVALAGNTDISAGKAAQVAEGKLLGTVKTGGMIFSDLKHSHWAAAEIEELVNAGIISGYPDGTFKPSRDVTYGEFIKMVYAAKTGKVIMNETKGHWAGNYYYGALAEGYFDSDLINEGVLSKPIPRKHMAHIAAYVIKADTSDDENIELFEDITAISENSYEIMTACSAGILNGYEDGTFAPDRTLTRAEAAAVITRLWKYEGAEEICADENAGGEKEENAKTKTEGPQGHDRVNAGKDNDADDDEVFIRKTETAGGIVPVRYDIRKCSMRDMGLVKVEYASANTINIYSSVQHPFVFMMLGDGKYLKPVGFPGGFSVEKDGYHLYIADPEGRSLEDEPVYFMFEDGDKVYEFTDFEILRK